MLEDLRYVRAASGGIVAALRGHVAINSGSDFEDAAVFL
jgi:hypothetical protein